MKKALTEQTRSPVLVSLESVELCVPAIPRMTNKREQVPVTNIVETAGKQSFTPLIFHGNTPKMQDRWFKAFAKVCAEVTSSFTLGMYPIGLSSSFLSHIIFNMPSSSRHIENAACALHMNGGLVAFNPSITQMMSIVEIIKRKNLPLHLDQIVELGHTMTGGREWDVRMVKPRGLTGTDGDKKTTNSDADDEESPKQRFGDGDDVEYALTETAYCDETQTPATKDGGWQMVCRSKVGERIVGGGFLGVWKKMKK